MHRSGTSAISSAFEAAGYFPGIQEELIPSTPSNPVGHFELASTAIFFDSLLNELGYSWFNPPPPDQKTLNQNVIFEKVAKYLYQLRIKLSQASSQKTLLKDHRFCLFFPEINEALKGAYLNVFVFRNPLEVALSLSVRDGIPVSIGLELWNTYMSSLLPWLKKSDFVTVDFDELVENSKYTSIWQSQHKDLFERMGLNLPDFTTIKSEYKHHNVIAQSLSQQMTKPVAEIWELCKNLSMEDANKEVVYEVPSATRQSLSDFAKLFEGRSSALVQRDDALVQRDAALVQRDDALVQRANALKALFAIRNSKTWRYTSLFRSARSYIHKYVSR